MNTPRTDALLKDSGNDPHEAGWIEHARQLETELAAVKADYQKNDEQWIAREFELLAEIGELDAENDALLRGEYICKKCGIRKDGEGENGDF